VAGRAGFIGPHLVEAILGDGLRVHVLDNMATGHRPNLAHLEWMERRHREGEARRPELHPL
jgi:nucleoside-diphosphate-sugar epimerase